MYDYSQENKERNVAVYARVSTEHEAQLSALENQIDWYKPIFEQHPEWTLVRQYVDEGITGTAAHKRPQFMQMINDADNGEFDLIITREVSRFARNTVDTLQYTRQLKTKGVEVFFLNDNIRTFDGDGELRLTIMATLAQDESRKTSIRVKSGQQTSMEKGVFYGNGNILGYDRVGDKMIINPEQAKTVRMIFDLYLAGWGLRKIQFELERRGRLTAMGKPNWHCSVIKKTLQNTFYCGIITYHKEFTPDFLEQRKIANYGEVEFTRVKGTHEPIVTEEEFAEVQRIFKEKSIEIPSSKKNRERRVGIKPKKDVWCKLLKCSCGCEFGRSTWHKYAREVQYGYYCYGAYRSGSYKTRMAQGLDTSNTCKSPSIAGWKLQLMARHIFEKFVSDTDDVVQIAMSLLEKHINDKPVREDNNRVTEQKTSELSKLNNRLDNLIEMRADGDISKEMFQNKKQEIEDRISCLQNELAELEIDEEPEQETDFLEKIEHLRDALEKYVDFTSSENIPDSIIEAFVSKIVVSETSFDWYLRLSPNYLPDSPISVAVEGNKRHATVQELTTYVNSSTGSYC